MAAGLQLLMQATPKKESNSIHSSSLKEESKDRRFSTDSYLPTEFVESLKNMKKIPLLNLDAPLK